MSGILFRDSWEEELITAIDSQHVAHLERMLRDRRREDRLQEYAGDLLTSEVSPLHHAASIGADPAVIRTLVRTGRANPNAYQSLIGGRTRVTPLHVAIRDLRPEVVEILIESGADPELPGVVPDGKAPVEYAKELLGLRRRRSRDREDVLAAEKLKEIVEILEKEVMFSRLLRRESGSRTLDSFIDRNNINLEATLTSIEDAPHLEAAYNDTDDVFDEAPPSTLDLKAKQRELDTALGLQEELTSAEAELKALEAEHKRKMTALKEEFNSAKLDQQEKIIGIQNKPGFRSNELIQDLADQIAAATTATATTTTSTPPKTRTNRKPLARRVASISSKCPVCYDLPKEIYCCQRCDNMVCGSCVPKVQICPMCRDDFNAKPPKRNRFAERIMLGSSSSQ